MIIPNPLSQLIFGIAGNLATDLLKAGYGWLSSKLIGTEEQAKQKDSPLAPHLSLDALNMALENHSAPQIHHSDQGVQYAAQAYANRLNCHQVQISMAAVGKA